MPAILGQFRKSFPGVEIVLYDVPAHQLVEKLLTTDAEFALGGLQGQFPDVMVERILRGRISVIGTVKELGARKQIAWDDLASSPTITMRRENVVRAAIDAALAKSGRRFDPSIEVSLFNTALSLTAAGNGLTVLPDYLVSRQQFPTLIAKPLVSPAIDWQVSLIRKIGRSLSPAATRFVGLVKAQFGRMARSKELAA
jgi:DNA-binding transcriptional LysR family regulator